MALTSVVLPTPGPPVMTSARLVRACLSASRWLGASSLPVFCWHQATAFSKSIAGKADGERKAPDPGGDDFLGPLEVRQEDQFLPVDRF